MKIDFDKGNGLVPVIIQDDKTSKVLMMAYMNKESLESTKETGKVTFFSRSRNKLWTKGETSGNYLELVSIAIDCDGDTLLIKVDPTGPVCHTGKDTCFDEKNSPSNFLFELERIIKDRKENPKEGSYTNYLFDKGIKKIAQKVGEEATETIIEALDGNVNLLKEETGDLLYHLIVLLQANNLTLNDVSNLLESRHK